MTSPWKSDTAIYFYIGVGMMAASIVFFVITIIIICKNRSKDKKQDKELAPTTWNENEKAVVSRKQDLTTVTTQQSTVTNPKGATTVNETGTKASTVQGTHPQSATVFETSNAGGTSVATTSK